MRTRTTIFRWDLDKTYLVSDFDTLRELVRVPFEKAEDKVSVPGVACLMKALRRSADREGHRVGVYFLSASPPQIGAAIRAKLEMDGIVHDGITFKDQVRHLVRGRFDAIREQIGYKLTMLLRSALEIDAPAREYLFGDDWESDPFVYSLYADIVAGRVGRDVVAGVLRAADVHKHYATQITALMRAVVSRPRNHVVAGVFIIRQRPAASAALDAFGERLAWFDNYFECALRLYLRGLIDADGVEEVAVALDPGPVELAASITAAHRRADVEQGRLWPVLRRLRRAGLIGSTDGVRPGAVVAAATRRALRLSPAPQPRARAVPAYLTLVDRWSYRGRKEVESDG